MKFIPNSSATRTDRIASFKSTFRNSAPSDDAPKLRIGTERPVLPRERVCMVGIICVKRAVVSRRMIYSNPRVCPSDYCGPVLDGRTVGPPSAHDLLVELLRVFDVLENDCRCPHLVAEHAAGAQV